MSKIVIAVSPEGVVRVASHVIGPGFCVVPVSDVGAAKTALKYNENGTDARLMRLRMAELSRQGHRCRVEDLTFLDGKVAPATFDLNSDTPVHCDISGDSE